MESRTGVALLIEAALNIDLNDSPKQQKHTSLKSAMKGCYEPLKKKPSSLKRRYAQVVTFYDPLVALREGEGDAKYTCTKCWTSWSHGSVNYCPNVNCRVSTALYALSDPLVALREGEGLNASLAA